MGEDYGIRVYVCDVCCKKIGETMMDRYVVIAEKDGAEPERRAHVECAMKKASENQH